MLPLPALDDPEGPRLPPGLPPVVDSHVHIFPTPLFQALWRWFDRYGWPVRYRLETPQVVEYLLSRGVDRLVALQFAHRPAMARSLNIYMAAICRAQPRVTGLATVFPGEEHATTILEEAFDLGLAGVKLHLHVQGLGPDDPALEPIYRACEAQNKPLVMHAGREPRSPAYPRDPHETCAAAKVEEVLRRHPGLRLCVPHLGADEYEEYLRLLLTYDNLWLDTTMMLAGYFPLEEPWRLVEARPERIMYGTDFPNIPYAWDRELRRLLARRLERRILGQILGATAQAFFGAAP